MPAPFWSMVAVFFGLVFGSFLSVCIYRIPYGRYDEEEEELDPNSSKAEPVEAAVGGVSSSETNSAEGEPAKKETFTIFFPARSFCPECRKTLSWWQNIPVLSWLLLRGRCSFCKAPISVRYPTVELLSAGAALFSLHAYGDTPLTAVVVYAFIASLIVISFIDIDYYIIPNVISIPGTLIGIALSGVNEVSQIFAAPLVENVWESALGILCGGGLLFAVSELYFLIRRREGLGLGDVKLLAMTGAFFGYQGAFYTMFFGSLLGSFCGILFIVFFGKKLSYALPFGPYLALGTVGYLVLGSKLFGLQ